MKKPVGKRVFLCVLSVVLLVVLAAGAICWAGAQKGPVAYDADTLEALSRDMNTYTLSCVFDEEEGTLDVVQEIAFQNRTGDTLPDLVLRTYANAFAAEETSPAAIDELYDNTYGGAFSEGYLTLQDVRWRGETVETVYDDAAQTVLRLQTGDIAPGESGVIKLYYVLIVPDCAYRFGRTESAWQFGNALPTLAVWEQGAWRTEEYYPIGDPFISESANWEVELSLPDGFVPACSARMEQGRDGVWRGKILCARDFAMAISCEYQVVKRTFGDVQVQVFTTKNKGQKTLNISGKVLDALCQLYGPYPYDTLTIAQVDFPFGGMEYPGMVFVGSDYFDKTGDELELLLCHEIAHQWFYALRGSDGFYQPWQDEALCQWATIRYVHAVYGADSAQNLRYYYIDAPMEERVLSDVTPGSPVSYFGDYATYDSVVYGRGCAFLAALHTFTNGQTDAFLKEYCHQKPFGLSKRQDFEDALAAFTGEDLSPLLTDYLDTLMQ